MTRSFRQFYCSVPLHEGQRVTLPEALQHRLGKVLRLREGDSLHLFDGTTGRYAATIADVKVRTVDVGPCVAPFIPQTRFSLMLGLPKRDAWETALRQATEMGVTDIYPLACAFSVADKINAERAHALVTEAAEQCERLDVPTVHPLTPLQSGMAAWRSDNPEATLAWADERRLATTPQTLPPATGLLIGPEGGFADTEQAWLEQQPLVQSISLGTTVLKVDTAVVSGLSQLRHG